MTPTQETLQEIAHKLFSDGVPNYPVSVVKTLFNDPAFRRLIIEEECAKFGVEPVAYGWKSCFDLWIARGKDEVTNLPPLDTTIPLTPLSTTLSVTRNAKREAFVQAADFLKKRAHKLGDDADSLDYGSDEDCVAAKATAFTILVLSMDILRLADEQGEG